MRWLQRAAPGPFAKELLVCEVTAPSFGGEALHFVRKGPGHFAECSLLILMTPAKRIKGTAHTVWHTPCGTHSVAHTLWHTPCGTHRANKAPRSAQEPPSTKMWRLADHEGTLTCDYSGVGPRWVVLMPRAFKMKRQLKYTT